MEKLKVKHDHTLTDIIKVAIFALFLILPILMFLPTGLYYGFNEHANAQEVTKQEPIYYESNEVNNIDDIVIGNIYQYRDNYTQRNVGGENRVCEMNIDFFKSQFITYANYDIEHAYIYYVPNNTLRILIYYNSNDSLISLQFSISETPFKFIPISINPTLFEQVLLEYTSYTDYQYFKEYQPEVYTQDISQSMNNAWQSLWTTPMLSWTDTNTFQFTINAFVTVFGITQESYLANYLTYILVITCIYLVFDIVLTLTTKLTHLINEK